MQGNWNADGETGSGGCQKPLGAWKEHKSTTQVAAGYDNDCQVDEGVFKV